MDTRASVEEGQEGTEGGGKSATLQRPSSHKELVTSILDNTDREHSTVGQCQLECYLQKIQIQAFVGSLRTIPRKLLPLVLVSQCWSILSFIRLNKLINSADSERLHNLSNVNSHLNYPNFILNLQNPITS